MEAHRLPLPLEAQLGRGEITTSPRQEGVERHGVEPLARRVEAGQQLPGHGLSGPGSPADAAAAALGRFAAREEQLHQHPPREQQLLATGVEA